MEKTYRVVALPTTYVIGPDGVITAKQVGPVDFDWLHDQTK
ncbi:peroxiredoxin family protein [Exiguobacterium mexicanum]